MSHPFIGRKEEGRALLLGVQKGRSTLLVAPPGYGKSRLLEEVRPALAAWALLLWADKVGPFNAFLRDLFRELWDAKVPIPGVTYSRKLEDDLKAWGRSYTNSEEKARSIVAALRQYQAGGINRPILVIEDVSSVTPSMVPWLVAFSEVATLVCGGYPETVRKAGTRKLWMRLDRIDLPPLGPRESQELADALIQTYGIVAEDLEVYRARICALAGGIPGELVRLVRYVEAEAIVKNQDVGTGYAQNRAQREERGIALAPILLVLGGVGLVVRTLGLARGEMDLYVAGAVMVGLFVITGPWLRKALVVQ
jgi:hypothetical protein